MGEQEQAAKPPESARAPAAAAELPAGEPGPVVRQLQQVAAERGLKPGEGQELMALLAAAKIDSPIPLEAMATVSGILLFLFQVEARFSGDERSGAGR